MKKIFLAGIAGLAYTGQLTAQKPNIVYIFTDQQTATVMSCAGNLNLHTPNMVTPGTLNMLKNQTSKTKQEQVNNAVDLND